MEPEEAKTFVMPDVSFDGKLEDLEQTGVLKSLIFLRDGKEITQEAFRRS